MAANLNAGLNLDPLIERLLDNPYGLAIFIFLAVLGVLILIFGYIFKSGILNSIREHQEYKDRRVREEIKDQQDLLEDEAFKRYKNQIKYHLGLF